MRFKQTLALIFRYKSIYNLGLSCILLRIGIQRFFAPFIACLLFVERRLNWCQLCKHTDVRLQEEQDGQGGGARQVKVSLSAARTTQGSTPMFCWPLCFSILSRLCVSNTLKPWLYIYICLCLTLTISLYQRKVRPLVCVRYRLHLGVSGGKVSHYLRVIWSLFRCGVSYTILHNMAVCNVLL